MSRKQYQNYRWGRVQHMDIVEWYGVMASLGIDPGFPTGSVEQVDRAAGLLWKREVIL